MTDREKVIKGLHCCAHTDGINCVYCPYDNTDEDCTALMSMDVLELLKEQEAVKPVRDETGRLWLCGNCGSYVGFEDHDEDDPNEFNKFCSECGRPVLWEGR